ncbi:MAG: class I SAM-dependent methyltransferase [Leptospiraceae bacterium]|nr:class I SAM-dependent methyltransferase [Leptospiraceae bacterium]MCP5499166.1 class I SAM-dependent methyltransferase [Leptospiraceae bacterium]
MEEGNNYLFKILSDTFQEPILAIKQEYDLNDFLVYKDEIFIQNLFRGILQREASEEEYSEYLQLLQSGRSEKIQIMGKLRYSKEGKEKNIKVKGLKGKYIFYLIFQIPILGYFLNLVRLILKLPKLFPYIESLHTVSQKRSYSFSEALLKELEPEQKEMKQTLEKIKQQQSGLESSFSRIANQENLNITKTLNIFKKEAEHILDAFYLDFENKFRGEKERIKNRLGVYLPYIRKLQVDFSENLKALDLGCGRGEWLELLKEESIQIKGLDLNRSVISELQEFGYDVIEEDVIQYINSLESASLHILTAFHLVEHLPFPVLMTLVNEAYRVLKPGGILILETPNPENILVGSQYFYIDPTHRNPIPPAALQFIVQYKGFASLEVKRLPNDFKVEYNMTTDESLNSIIKHFTASMDYSIIAYK